MWVQELERLDGVGEAVGRRAAGFGAVAIRRAQVRASWSTMVRDGRVESTSHSTVSGQGIQVCTAEGYTALASRDDFRAEPALALVDRAVDAAARGAALGLHETELPTLTPDRGRSVPPQSADYRDVDLAAVGVRLREFERDLLGRVPGVTLRLGYRAELDGWRIVRSDGGDVLFAMPRTTLSLHASAGGEDGRHGVGVAMHAGSPDAPWNDAVVESLLNRGEEAARLALRLPDAPTHPAGSFPAVIDFALAKGLAHEAFGHASESDGYRSSVLARGGRFRAGEVVGADHVTIVDEPVPDDHAWQPFSANGVRRERVVLVDGGRLRDGLSDIWSAVAGGVPLSGAGRAESYRDAPVPRMTNIRIEVEDPRPAPGAFEDWGPDEVRGLLADAGIFRRHPRVAFLSGYSGGQVNSTTGDFVFHCKAIYALTEDGVELHKPAIFSGSMFGALGAIREAFGPLRLDALGYCGKWGQSVPSSGGSHYFLMLEPDPTVRLGGR